MFQYLSVSTKHQFEENLALMDLIIHSNNESDEESLLNAVVHQLTVLQMPVQTATSLKYQLSKFMEQHPSKQVRKCRKNLDLLLS